ncbi:MAG: heme ABC exporter ATP-binding protein CcmA [Burkholderiales bacterium]|nr:heme ABC exporter ATP-binding protein CcmA [Anaerolineae bacterium]
MTHSDPGTQNSALIVIHALVKAYGLMPVLRKLDLSIERGEFVALLGANGSGKSTLLRLLTGLSQPTAGTITVGGWEMPREADAVRAQIGLVSHKPLLYENLTARENLAFFARLYNLSRADADARTKQLLERVGLIKRRDDAVRTFSRGMQQRLSIARALLHDPAILLLDEPYTGLDVDAAAMLDQILTENQRVGRTIIMAVHDIERAASLASRVVMIARGVVGYDAPSSALDAAGLAEKYSQVGVGQSTGVRTAS